MDDLVYQGKPNIRKTVENRDQGPSGDDTSIDFSKVEFSHSQWPASKVLLGVSMTVQPGSYVAFVGPSGCGKSTIISLVERFYDPASGRITLDGDDVARMPPILNRRHMSLVHLNYEPSEAELDEACRQANVQEFVSSLPEGLDTPCGAKGIQFSGGQRQRLAVARALIRKPRLLLLDEATSALDTQNERIVQEALNQAVSSRTTIAIVHRLSTIRHADVIFVIEDGKIAEMGTHEDLQRRDEPEPGSKRKADDSIKEEDPAEEAEEAEPDSKKTRKTINPTLQWLLSDDAFALAFPTLPEGHGEIDWDDTVRRKEPPPEDAGKHAEAEDNDDDHDEQKHELLLTYPDSHLTPFQNLVAALILSKPLSHRLGMRTINTLLNAPFGLRTVRDLDEAGFEGRRKVMWEARTQHKEKTAAQLGDLVEGVQEVNGGEEGVEELKGLKKQLEGLEVGDAQKKVEEVLSKVKGIGPTGTGIFMRRVQEDWDDVFPYADQRALDTAVQFGLMDDGQGVEKLAEQLDGDRAKLVKLLDVLVGVQLEKKLDEALEKAGVEK
ncbi:uncharacterized protein HMPREF1541_06185 [Cyphellophora europaea CBS 101466]|uniref:ABC transporter domain-containing protein n=1 Tax=Cyphellophora europaea (strain CBS 101466) TaxID=1220924 RepID=W2RW26_CYPE1|nr:uncharacterized protein HMPREF1541_06185 [Cyphellophora europaea CBS 101466]ETN39958.1 hypothetical protein HMPREF1541_06185 [Cyphellophora europaea CBS 101466]